jgi:hypothetical protein
MMRIYKKTLYPDPRQIMQFQNNKTYLVQSCSLGEDSRRASGREKTPAGLKEGRRALQRGGASAPDDCEEPARPPAAITRPTQERFP